ncbi:MAG: hypothetical protein JXA00_01180 [Candidatus Thermoplasmatota archaeon]|nr:hypothetical protein [Candidatus Thermoplasmatota archaeon]
MMKKNTVSIVLMLVVFTLVSTSLVSSAGNGSPPLTSGQEDWIYLPSYPNYSPMGLPDFDQRQDNWKARQGIWRFVGGLWSFCGPTCLADVFWWFDARHEDPEGYPGDGNDSYPLVRDFHAPGTPTPGPCSDDHNFNNVNDALTPWWNGRGEKELVEQLAWYCNTNFCRYFFIRGFAGTYSQFLEKGAVQWITDAGLADHYAVESYENPSFSMIVDRLQQQDAVIINLLFYNPSAVVFKTFLGHYVAVAGIHPDGSIALCDPVQNIMNPGPSPAAHNDASVVSYDVYPVNFSSPVPQVASWWIEQYYTLGPLCLGGVAHYALIISETS